MDDSNQSHGNKDRSQCQGIGWIEQLNKMLADHRIKWDKNDEENPEKMIFIHKWQSTRLIF